MLHQQIHSQTLLEESPRASQERLLSVKEVAEILQVPRSWVYERTRQRGIGRLPHLKLGKYLRFRHAEVEEYLETLQRA